MSEIDDVGAQFFLGQAREVGAACMAWRWRDLRTGQASVAYLAFPQCVHSQDLLLLPRAIADVTGLPCVQIDHRVGVVAAEEGLWTAQAMPQAWVKVVSALPDESVEGVCERWAILIRDEYGVEWDTTAVADALRQLVEMARRSRGEHHDVVALWAL